MNPTYQQNQRLFVRSIGRFFTTLAIAFCLFTPMFAQVKNAEDAIVVKANWSVDAAKPGQQIVLAVVVDVASGYHIGNTDTLIPAKNKASVMPTTVQLSFRDEVVPGVLIGRANFPGEAANGSEAVTSSQIEGQAIVYIPVDCSKQTKTGTLHFELAVNYQACDDQSCFKPAEFNQQLSLKVVSESTLTTGCPSPSLFSRWSDRRAVTPSNQREGTDYKSKEPPIGPPWVRDLATAQKLALQSGRPIFLYSTKTFCPHCVIVESELLSSPDLKPYYDKAIWLYVYRDFQGGEVDRSAERITDRYSLSSWPQLWLIDPHNLATIGETGRTVETFAEAVENVEIKATKNFSVVESLKESEAKVVEFDRSPTRDVAFQLIESDDIVAQLAAVRFLAKEKQLDDVTNHAKRLLAIPNDGLRYEILKAVAQTGKGDVAPEIAKLVSNPRPSRNFNVLRSHAIKALASCGDGSSIEVIAPHAQGTARNSTARISIQAMLKLVSHHPECKAEVTRALANSFPPIEKGVERLVNAHAKMVHGNLVELTGRDVDFPESYNEETRSQLIKQWSAQ
jgi:hypothetical protein